MSEIKKNNCYTCGHAKLDELWGDFKCLKYQYRIYNPALCWLWDPFNFIMDKAEDGDCSSYIKKED